MKIELSVILKELKQHRALENLTKDDLEKVASKAAKSFIGKLSADEIQSCVLNAFWKAIDKYNSEKECKFTTYFYKGVVMECLTQNKFNLNKSPARIHEGIISFKNNSINEVDMLDEINTYCDDPSIIYDRFYNNMSINEIANNLGVCNETIRIKIKKNLHKLKCKLTKYSV